MSDEIQVGATFHKKRVGKHIAMVEGPPPAVPDRPKGRLPRITRYMALAIYYEDLINQGHVHDYAEIATLGHVTRASAEVMIEAQMGDAARLQKLDDFFWPTTTMPIVRGWSFVIKVDLHGSKGSRCLRSEFYSNSTSGIV